MSHESQPRPACSEVICRAPRGASVVSALTLLSALLAPLLGGCAAQMSYRDAQSLLASDQAEAGLTRLQDAVAQDPGNVEYRVTYQLTRQKVLAIQLELAGKAVVEDRRSDAGQHFRRALEIDPGSSAARSGLAALLRDARHAQMLDAAGADWESKNTDAARAQVLAVLDDDPRNERARALLRTIDARSDAVMAESRLAGAYRKKVSIDFKDATIKQVFDVIARSSGLNILFDKDVKTDQKSTISLKDSSVEAAIYYMLITNQLEQQVMDVNTVLIFPNSAAKLKDYQQLVVKTFVLANASAKTVAEMIRTMVKSRDVVIDEKLNMVILRDSPEAVRLAEKLVALQDVAEPEVMLDVEILEVSRDRLMELGVAWPGSVTLAPLTSNTGVGLSLRDLRSLARETVGVTIDPLKINARKVDGDTNLLANPRIRVLNREKARIVIGNKVPSVSTTLSGVGGFATETVTYLDVGLKLDVEPIIYVNNDVTIKLALEVSNVISFAKTTQGSTTYNIGTRSANTTLRLKDGENQVLAGLISDEDRHTANKVPGLGELPLAGRLFGSTLNDGKKTEIVLSITPRLIRNIQRPVASAAEFLSGTDNSLRRRPAPSGGEAPVQIESLPKAVPVPAAVPATPVTPSGPPPAALGLHSDDSAGKAASGATGKPAQ